MPLMTGYAERAGVPADELNADAFAGGVYHTGDVVTRDADGYLTFVGGPTTCSRPATTGSARSSWSRC